MFSRVHSIFQNANHSITGNKTLMILKIELVSEVGDLLRILEVFLVPDLEYKQRPEGFPVVDFFL